MLCLVYKNEILGFFESVMGSFFCCFGLRRNLVSKTPVTNTTEPVVSRNRLSTLLQAEEDSEEFGLSTPEQINERKFLKNEARFLKACGTIAQTPVEIQKVSERYEDVLHSNEGSEPFRFHSLLPNASIEKLTLEKQVNKGWVNDEEPLKFTPNSITQDNGAGNATDGTSSIRTPSGTAVAASEQPRNKSVRFKLEDDVASFSSMSSSSGTGGFYSKQHASGAAYSTSKPSTYPTPLQITDEMQTPGTVFPAKFEGEANMKIPQIRSQFVYSSLNPVESISQLKLLKDDYSFDNAKNLNMKAEEASVEKVPTVNESLSSWLKPSSTNHEGKKNPVQTPDDRPIIGLVAAHWNEKDEASRISPKYWDGNGIPNSTNKYKEDQKVSWHATPFEERLEKALSEESINLRKDNTSSLAIDLEDTDENDTALSQLQPSTYSKAMVSF